MASDDDVSRRARASPGRWSRSPARSTSRPNATSSTPRSGSRAAPADGAFTDEGRSEREAVERATDRQCRPVVDALGDDVDELLAILVPWAQAIRDAHGYPASGPHDLARASA